MATIEQPQTEWVPFEQRWSEKFMNVMNLKPTPQRSTKFDLEKFVKMLRYGAPHETKETWEQSKKRFGHAMHVCVGRMEWNFLDDDFAALKDPFVLSRTNAGSVTQPALFLRIHSKFSLDEERKAFNQKFSRCLIQQLGCSIEKTLHLGPTSTLFRLNGTYITGLVILHADTKVEACKQISELLAANARMEPLGPLGPRRSSASSPTGKRRVPNRHSTRRPILTAMDAALPKLVTNNDDGGDDLLHDVVSTLQSALDIDAVSSDPPTLLCELWDIVKAWASRRHIHGSGFGYLHWSELFRWSREAAMGYDGSFGLPELALQFFDVAEGAVATAGGAAHRTLSEIRRAKVILQRVVLCIKQQTERVRILGYHSTKRMAGSRISDECKHASMELFAEPNIFRGIKSMAVITDSGARHSFLFRVQALLLTEGFAVWDDVLRGCNGENMCILWSQSLHKTDLEAMLQQQQQLESLTVDVVSRISDFANRNHKHAVCNYFGGKPLMAKLCKGTTFCLRRVAGSYAPKQHELRKIMLDKLFPNTTVSQPWAFCNTTTACNYYQDGFVERTSFAMRRRNNRKRRCVLG